MKTVGVIDVGIGNALAVCNSLEEVGLEPDLLQAPEKNLNYNIVVLPGVGNFGKYAQKVEGLGWDKFLLNLHSSTQILGICVGFQYFAKTSAESPSNPGLGIIDAQVKPLSSLYEHGNEMLSDFNFSSRSSHLTARSYQVQPTRN